MRYAICLCLAVLVIGCSQNNGSLQAMGSQPRYDPLAPSRFFANGMAAQPVISDTVTFMAPVSDTLLYTGMVNGAPATTYPFAIDASILARGQERYNVYCAPCHGAAGDGKGYIATRGYCCPSSFHTDALRSAPEGHFFAVITNGIRQMPSYAAQIPVRDRWAIVAYVRALQFSQNATLNDVPPEERNALGGTPAP